MVSFYLIIPSRACTQAPYAFERASQKMQQFQAVYITQAVPCDTSQLLCDGAVYKALGLYNPPRGGAYLYAIATRTGIGLWRAADMGGLSLLLELYPDIDHWRAAYPKGVASIDAKRARAAIMRECVEAGPYVPPEGIALHGPSSRIGRARDKA